jgi:preprotein translocase subunit SecG
MSSIKVRNTIMKRFKLFLAALFLLTLFTFCQCKKNKADEPNSPQKQQLAP